MAQMNNEGPNISHFSHEHPMELAIVGQGGNATCSGCNMTTAAGREYYTCRPCSYSLHRVCSRLPTTIQHPAEPGHHLNPHLMLSFQCKACGLRDSGFSYSCGSCLTNYHALCVLRPLTESCSSHQHELKLQFSPPYEGIDGFCYDICGNPGSNQWLYRCSDCEYDVHLICIYAVPIPQPHAGNRRIREASGGHHQNTSICLIPTNTGSYKYEASAVV